MDKHIDWLITDIQKRDLDPAFKTYLVDTIEILRKDIHRKEDILELQKQLINKLEEQNKGLITIAIECRDLLHNMMERRNNQKRCVIS
jgi:hypothetical protein